MDLYQRNCHLHRRENLKSHIQNLWKIYSLYVQKYQYYKGGLTVFHEIQTREEDKQLQVKYFITNSDKFCRSIRGSSIKGSRIEKFISARAI
jgi:hypothetical protein